MDFLPKLEIEEELQVIDGVKEPVIEKIEDEEEHEEKSEHPTYNSIFVKKIEKAKEEKERKEKRKYIRSQLYTKEALAASKTKPIKAMPTEPKVVSIPIEPPKVEQPKVEPPKVVEQPKVVEPKEDFSKFVSYMEKYEDIKRQKEEEKRQKEQEKRQKDEEKNELERLRKLEAEIKAKSATSVIINKPVVNEYAKFFEW